MFEGDKLIAKVPLSLRNSFSYSVVFPDKMRNCKKCTKDNLCNDRDKLVNPIKDFSANPIELKRQPPTGFSHLLPKYITTRM